MWIKNLLTFNNCPDVVAISGPPRYLEKGKIVHLGTELFLFFFKVFHKYYRPIIQGGNFVLKADVLMKVGGHNTDILFYGEDTDLAKRLSKVGEIKFLESMWIDSSFRRYEKEGIFNVIFKYMINYFSIHIINKPLTRSYQDVRNIN